MGSLSGKVAIVTGASNGIGRAIAERFAEDGAIVVVNHSKSPEKAQQVVIGIQAKGGKALAVQADMSRVAEARRLVRDTVAQFGRLDILVIMRESSCRSRWKRRRKRTSTVLWR